MSIIYFLSILLLLLANEAHSKKTHHHSKHTNNPQVVRIQPYIIDYGNGTVVRDPIAAPSFSPPPHDSQVQAKDITISNNLRARVILPARPDPARRIPILVYFHGGAFCIGSAFGWGDTTYLARVSAEANVITVAIDYHLYPEHTIPAPYQDAWAALRWVAAHRISGRAGRVGLDPWLAQYGDVGRVYVGGDSAGGNIAHNVAIRAGLSPLPNSVTITGLFLAMPYFLGSKRVPFEPATIIYSPNYKVWAYVCGKCKGGVDNGFINPFGPGARRLSGLKCKKVLVYTAEIDELRGRGRWYYQQVKASGFKGQAQWVEAQGQGHVFHISKPQDPATTKLISDLSTFLNTH